MEWSNSSNSEPTQSNNPEIVELDLLKEVGVHQNSNVKARSSRFRGVQKVKDKETYIAHVYDNGHSPNEARTIYLGRFDKDEKAARAHDLISIKFWGTTAITNFPLDEYEKEIESMANMSDQDVMAAVRRSSSSFSRGKSKYRGVVGHTSSGKWQARKGPGKESFLGTYDSEEEAATAFDVVSIKHKGYKAVTNFDLSRYNVPAILEAKLEIGQGTNDVSDSSTPGNRRSKKKLVNLQQYLAKPPKNGLSIEENAIIAPTASRFQAREALIPFFSGALSIGSSSTELNSNSNFKHSDSSAFQCYYPIMEPNYNESNNNQEANLTVPGFELWSPNLHPSYETSLYFKELEFKDHEVGFHHASSSCFKPFIK